MISALEQENEQLKAEIARLKEWVYQDALTGIANRRFFDETLEREWRRAARNQAPIALLMMDLDFFKQYNDTHGHPAGDILLQVLSAAWQTVPLRAPDLLARYGGEEFAVILPETTANEAAIVAERFQNKARQIGQTISIGYAAGVPEPSESHKALVDQADKALYVAKRSGRDRAEVYVYLYGA